MDLKYYFENCKVTKIVHTHNIAQRTLISKYIYVVLISVHTIVSSIGYVVLSGNMHVDKQETTFLTLVS